jgi:hypothetical protein
MSAVVVTSGQLSSAWNSSTHSGSPAAKARMVSFGSFAGTYGFPYTPVEIDFSDLSSDYVEIDRPGDYKLIERRGPQLARASFTFLVADRASNGLRSVEGDLAWLARMVNTDGPVAFAGLGSALTNGPAGVRLWRVTDFSVKVRRRNPSDQISQAECQITVTEDRNPAIAVATLPRITYSSQPPAASPTTSRTTATAKTSAGGSGGPPPPTRPKGYSTLYPIKPTGITTQTTTSRTTDRSILAAGRRSNITTTRYTPTFGSGSRLG